MSFINLHKNIRKSKYWILLSLFIVLLFAFNSCKKDTADNNPKNKEFKNGLLVLCEGLFHQNNSTLAWVDLNNYNVIKDVFQSVNNRPLGDTANDMIIYGNKIYIAITTSSAVEVLDKTSLKSLRQILFNYNDKSQQPRYLAAANGNVFITSFDGYVSVLDTVNYQIKKRIKVGRNPEGICVSGQSLWVANSGGLDFGNMDTSVMKIDLQTLQVVDTFIVGENPGRMISDDYDNVYVVKQGDFMQNPSELVKINTVDKSVVNLEIPATSVAKRGDDLYISYYDVNSSLSSVAVFNCATQNLIHTNIIASGDITTLFGVFPFNQDELIVFDAMEFTQSGYLQFFNSSGQLTKSLNVGLNPNTIIKIK